MFAFLNWIDKSIWRKVAWYMGWVALYVLILFTIARAGPIQPGDKFYTDDLVYRGTKPPIAQTLPFYGPRPKLLPLEGTKEDFERGGVMILPHPEGNYSTLPLLQED